VRERGWRRSGRGAPCAGEEEKSSASRAGEERRRAVREKRRKREEKRRKREEKRRKKVNSFSRKFYSNAPLQLQLTLSVQLFMVYVVLVIV